jgi:hypothetical protein
MLTGALQEQKADNRRSYVIWENQPHITHGKLCDVTRTL